MPISHSTSSSSSSQRRAKRHHGGVSAGYILCAMIMAALGFLAGSVTRTADGFPVGSALTSQRPLLLQVERTLSEHVQAPLAEPEVIRQHGALSEEEETSGLHFEEELSLTDLRVIIGVALILIALTLAFEVCKETLEESVPEDFEIILEKFFGELTVLGFLSMCTFLISKTGTLEKISEHVFGEEEELLEYVEFVHFALFFIMISFVIQVLGMIREADEQQHEWSHIDDTIRHQLTHSATSTEHDVLSTLQRRPWYTLICSRFWSSDESVRAREEAVFKALRREFILDRGLDEPFEPKEPEKRITDTFNFGRYLGLAQIHILSHAVEVQKITWLFFAVMAIALYGVAVAVHERVMALGWVWVASMWALYLGNFVLKAHLIQLRNSYLPNHGVHPEETTPLTTTDDDLPRWCFLNLEKYMQQRPFLAKCIVGGVPNRQQAHFWMDRHGPKYYLFFMQVNLIYAGIYSGLLLLEFIPFAYHEKSLPVFVLYVILALLPLFGILYNKRDLVALIAQVSSIGTYRKDQIVRDVLLEETTTRIVRTFLIIHRMRRVAEQGLPKHHTEGHHSNNGHNSMSHRNSFSELEKTEVGHSFDAFDSDKSGSISKAEFHDLLERLGAHVEEGHFERLVASLDTDGDGIVTKNEFINWYQYYAAHDNISLRQRAEDLFEMFDENHSGEITLGEFKNKLDALNMGFTTDEIGAILHVLDHDRSGSVSLEEFEELLHKYYPEELGRQEGHH